jgi:hypothetical protein
VLRKGADVLGDGSAVGHAEGRNHDVVVGLEGVCRGRQRRLRVGVADDCLAISELQARAGPQCARTNHRDDHLAPALMR